MDHRSPEQLFSMGPVTQESHEERTRGTWAAYRSLKQDFEAAVEKSGPASRMRQRDVSLCPYSLLGGLSLVVDGPEWQVGPKTREIWEVRKEEAMIWALCWATAPRSMDQRLRTLEDQCRCSGHQSQLSLAHCHGYMAVVYDTGRFHGRQPTAGERLLLMSLVAFELVKLGPDRPDGITRLLQLSTRLRWPRSVAEIFPRGCETTIASLAGWLNAPILHPYIRGRILQTLSQIYEYAHTLVMPVCVRSLDLLTGLTRSVTDSCDTILRLAASASTGLVQYQDGLQCIVLVSCIFQTFTMYTMRSARRDFCRLGKVELVTACGYGYSVLTKVQALLPATESQGISMSKEAATRLSRFAGDMFDMDPDLRHHPALQESANIRKGFFNICPFLLALPEHMQNFHWLQKALQFLAYDEKCGYAGCPRTPADTGRELLVCGGCRRMHYCSQRCQKRAWRHPQVPHRDLCSLLIVLGTELIMPRRRDVLFDRGERYIVNLHVPNPQIEKQARLLRLVVEKLDAWAVLDHKLLVLQY